MILTLRQVISFQVISLAIAETTKGILFEALVWFGSSMRLLAGLLAGFLVVMSAEKFKIVAITGTMMGAVAGAIAGALAATKAGVLGVAAASWSGSLGVISVAVTGAVVGAVTGAWFRVGPVVGAVIFKRNPMVRGRSNQFHQGQNYSQSSVYMLGLSWISNFKGTWFWELGTCNGLVGSGYLGKSWLMLLCKI